jgi:D-alanine-D-alanine ligase
VHWLSGTKKAIFGAMLKVGIFFGGQSREREISFAGGRTVYDNLNKELFTPVPIFVDSLGQFILLDWQFMYKGTIRDFYPSVQSISQAGAAADSFFQIYVESLGEYAQFNGAKIASEVGRLVQPSEFNELFDFAFLALHGPYGEDGAIQGLLEWYVIPYSGSGILPSAIGISKLAQDKLMKAAGFKRPLSATLSRNIWLDAQHSAINQHLSLYRQLLGWPLVIKAPAQGSSIGITILHESDEASFTAAINKAFFIQTISKLEWTGFSDDQKNHWVRTLSDIREGVGLPVEVHQSHRKLKTVYHPAELLHYLNTSKWSGTLQLHAQDAENEIIIEQFIKGREFSCIVIEDEMGQAIALPPTEIVKRQELFDYRSKYLPGMSRKLTPINVANEYINAIMEQCVELYKALQFNVYARIDGFITEEGAIFLNDPNTTSGMMPSSFFFHQAAEIGLNPSQFLSYIISTSINARIANGKKINKLIRQSERLDKDIEALTGNATPKQKIAVIMGGFSSERHISVESGRNIYEKLSSSTNYHPIPVFLTGSEAEHELYILPVNMMLKDNADDIRDKAKGKYKVHKVIEEVREKAASITQKYVTHQIAKPEKTSYKKLKSMVDGVFIALHGRPGEDGAVQKELEKLGIPYNGSGVASSQTTINKYETNEILRRYGILVANHRLVNAEEWNANTKQVIVEIEKEFAYPFITKPHDDGCSSAVKKIKNQEELIAFAELMFRDSQALMPKQSLTLNLKENEEFPKKAHFLIEDLISKEKADHFLEVTGGMLTQLQANGSRRYEMFEASEALASGEVLSLEEKFLAGEGQNITPARYSPKPDLQKKYSLQVKATLQKVCEVLDVEGYCRIDAFVRIYTQEQRAETVIIEVNSLPGMTPATAIFHQAAINGYRPYDFIDKILQYSFAKSAGNANEKA